MYCNTRGLLIRVTDASVLFNSKYVFWFPISSASLPTLTLFLSLINYLVSTYFVLSLLICVLWDGASSPSRCCFVVVVEKKMMMMMMQRVKFRRCDFDLFAAVSKLLVCPYYQSFITIGLHISKDTFSKHCVIAQQYWVIFQHLNIRLAVHSRSDKSLGVLIMTNSWLTSEVILPHSSIKRCQKVHTMGKWTLELTIRVFFLP